MSLRLEMLQVARLAPKILGDATGLVRGFLQRQQNEDGGFKDRTGKSDLYYTVFGIDGLIALQAAPPVGRLSAYLRQFGSGEGLDFVHFCCLARGWAAVSYLSQQCSEGRPAGLEDALLKRLENHRTPDGGFHPLPAGDYGTAYGCYLALGAYQDLRADLPEPMRLIGCLKLLETTDGAWTNERSMKAGSTNATAAAVTVLRNLSIPVNSAVDG